MAILLNIVKYNIHNKNLELDKARAIQMSKQVEYPELHHVSTTNGQTDCHQKKMQLIDLIINMRRLHIPQL